MCLLLNRTFSSNISINHKQLFSCKTFLISPCVHVYTDMCTYMHMPTDTHTQTYPRMHMHTQIDKGLPFPATHPWSKSRAPRHCSRELGTCAGQAPGAGQGACRSTACAHHLGVGTQTPTRTLWWVEAQGSGLIHLWPRPVPRHLQAGRLTCGVWRVHTHNVQRKLNRN